jgi:hypothetical protein
VDLANLRPASSLSVAGLVQRLVALVNPQVRINTDNKLTPDSAKAPTGVGSSHTLITVARYYLWRAFLLTELWMGYPPTKATLGVSLKSHS